MSWLRGRLHPTHLSHDELERQATEELHRLTADARGPSGPEPYEDPASEPWQDPAPPVETVTTSRSRPRPAGRRPRS